MRVLVTGGRAFFDRGAVYDALDAIDRETPITCVIHGAADGADKLADEWAAERRRDRLPFPAYWAAHVCARGSNCRKFDRCLAAGPIRNQRMVDSSGAQMAVAFAGNRGTADCVARARKAGLPVREIA